MAWQGIPFLLKGDEVFYHAEILLSQIPKIVLEMPEKGGGLEAFFTALIAGGIPAIVAYLAMRSNTKLITKQQVQHGEIADKTIKAQVVAANRQAWINEIRDLMSQFAADNRECFKRQWNYFCADELFSKYQLNDKNIKLDVFLEERRSAQRMLEDALRDRDVVLKKIHYVKNRILLMLNHEEAKCADLIEMMTSIENIAIGLTDDDLKTYRRLNKKLKIETDNFITASQSYLKAEWEAIKASL